MAVHAMCSISAVMFCLETHKTVSSYDTLIHVEEEGKRWDHYTVETFWSKTVKLQQTMQRIRRGDGVASKIAMDGLVSFLRTCDRTARAKGRHMIMGSNRLDVDVSWINHYLAIYGYDPLCHILGRFVRMIDTNSFHQGVAWITHQEIVDFEYSSQNISPSTNTNQRFHHNNNSSSPQSSVGSQNINTRTWFSINESAFRRMGIHHRPVNPNNHMSLSDAQHTAQAHAMILSKMESIKKSNMFGSSVSSSSYRIPEDWSSNAFTSSPESTSYFHGNNMFKSKYTNYSDIEPQQHAEVIEPYTFIDRSTLHIDRSFRENESSLKKDERQSDSLFSTSDHFPVLTKNHHSTPSSLHGRKTRPASMLKSDPPDKLAISQPNFPPVQESNLPV